MGSVFKIKPWLTAEDAAKYVSLETKQDIKSSDIYDLALNFKLTAYLRLSKAHMSLSHEAATYAVTYFTLPLQEDPEVNLEFSLPAFGATPLPKHKNMGALNDMNLLEREVDEYEGEIKSGIYELAMMDADKLMLANLKQSGGHIDSNEDGSRDQPITLLTEDEVIHYLLSYGIENRFNPVTTMPVGSDVVFEREEIDKLIEEINVTTAPKYTPLDTSNNKLEANDQDDELKPAERETLLKTIGALAKLAAHLGGNDLGTFEKPIASGLQAKLQEAGGKSLPKGFGRASLSKQISNGIAAYNRGKN